MTSKAPDAKSREEISTHTLTWSVTRQALVDALTATISTHTLTWSVTILQSKHDYQQVISTHTLTWSVTQGEYFLTA